MHRIKLSESCNWTFDYLNIILSLSLHFFVKRIENQSADQIADIFG